MMMMMMTRIIGELASSSDQEGRRNFVCQAKFWHNRQRQKRKANQDKIRIHRSQTKIKKTPKEILERKERYERQQTKERSRRLLGGFRTLEDDRRQGRGALL